MEQTTLSLEQALRELDRIAPGAPLLALGQTVFWDEPMKAGIALAVIRHGFERRFVAGVHDTDYFAKAPVGQRQPGKFKALPHNDTTTKGLWSAAGEISALFGSETVITKDTLLQAGLRVEQLERQRPGFLDEATEAWGWRGVCSLDEHPPVTAHVPLRQVWPELDSTFDWALKLTLDCLTGQAREEAERVADEIRSGLCDAYAGEGDQTLSEFYKALLPLFYRMAAGREAPIETTATTELLRFNSQTALLPRFEIVEPFIKPETRVQAAAAYDAAIEGSGLYGLSRFGTGAIPFDLVVSGHGRGTIRLGTRGAVIETPKPLFLSFKRPISSVRELADAVEAKFGPDCTLVGKAVTLIGMLAREFVFAFHEGASRYVVHSEELHGRLRDCGCELKLNPILRVRYAAWDALQASCVWLQLPEPFRRPFGAEDICSPSFASSWRSVAEKQEALLAELGSLTRPAELIAFLDDRLGGSWSHVASEYAEIQGELAAMDQTVSSVRAERRAMYPTLKLLKAERVKAEERKGDHFRSRIFEKRPTPEDLEERKRLTEGVENAIHALVQAEHKLKDLRARQDALVSGPEVQALHERRRNLEMEAELKRLSLIREAVIASRGLRAAGLRPSAWWFSLACPDGLWFRETVDRAECYFESL